MKYIVYLTERIWETCRHTVHTRCLNALNVAHSKRNLLRWQNTPKIQPSADVVCVKNFRVITKLQRTFGTGCSSDS